MQYDMQYGWRYYGLDSRLWADHGGDPDYPDGDHYS